MRLYIGDRAYVRANQIWSSEFPYRSEVVAENLSIPWGMEISDEGKIYFTERSGAIRVIENGELVEEPLMIFQSPFISQGEGGLMGIALDPDFSENHYMYVMHSYMENGQIYNRVVRVVEENNKAYLDQVILDEIPGGRSHNGGRLKIGPDQKLYITTGDAGNPQLSQDLTSTAGKILRIELDGSIPEDNPFPNSPIYSFGHRNPQGLAWNPNGLLYASEHGQIGNDEINIIQPGGNYGWPLVQGDGRLETIEGQSPLIHSGQNTWAPSGIAFIDQEQWPGILLVAALAGEQLLSIGLDEEGTQVREAESWLENVYGRLREVIQAEDGSIYLATSNMDGRGEPRSGDDKIIHLIPQNNLL